MSQVELLPPDVEVSEIKKEISSIETGLTDSSLVKLFSETKKSSVLYLAERYERLNELGASEIHTNEIANYLVKKFKSLGVKIADSTVYDNLPAKYKSHTPNPSINDDYSENRSENSSLITNYEQENEDVLQYLETHLDTIKNIISKLKTNAFVSKLDQKQLKEDLKLLYFADKVVNDSFDDRKSMPVSTQHIALRVYSEEAAKYAANKYVSKVKEFGGFKTDEALNNLMSFKQFRKLLTGKVKDLRDLYIPKSKEEAMERGYYGIRCSDMQCKSWRVFYEPITESFKVQKLDRNDKPVFDENKNPVMVKKTKMVNMCKCYACGRVMKPKTVRLPKETPGITIDYHRVS